MKEAISWYACRCTNRAIFHFLVFPVESKLVIILRSTVYRVFQISEGRVGSTLSFPTLDAYFKGFYEIHRSGDYFCNIFQYVSSVSEHRAFIFSTFTRTVLVISAHKLVCGELDRL